MHQWTGSTLIQVMACRLFGAKPLPEPVLAYCQLDSWEQTSVKFKSESFSFQKMHLKLSSPQMAAILSRERWVHFNPIMDKQVHPSSSVWRSYLSILKLQWLHQSSLGMDKSFYPTLCWTCDYLSILWLKLIHFKKRDPFGYSQSVMKWIAKYNTFNSLRPSDAYMRR